MTDIESEVLRMVKPTPAQDKRVLSIVEELTKKVIVESRKLDAHVELMLVGSVAKGTHLKDPDIDLFMLFPESTSPEKMKEAGLELGRRVIKGREHYAQHPYVRGIYKGFKVDLVPAFKIRDTRSKMSAVDRTPFHTDFVKKNLKKGMEDDVRLLKRFMKGIGCYGAEAKVQGFSGYLCELLTMRFGSFRKALEVATEWKVGEALELPNYPGSEFPEPLTFVDPVDSTRNVASAVAPETLLRFIVSSREYLKSPRLEFFFPKELEIWGAERIREVAGARLQNIVSVDFPKLDLIDDVTYPQLRKSLSAITALLERSEFDIEKTSVSVDNESHLLVELTSISLPKTRKHRGPPVNSENVSEFLAKWNSLGVSKPYTEDDRWYVMTERQFERADELIRAKIGSMPLGKDVQKQGKFEIISGERLLDKRHLAALTHHFDERMPWQR
ncbi:MAG: CCA-adding enzyme [Euryarchaeota archaeon RBG_19FT_COMBO_56_21]|nr:MAG: CCA-adding enzyme [Euryarchaeota archaeon RBG_19FT_COMBO_56_21]